MVHYLKQKIRSLFNKYRLRDCTSYGNGVTVGRGSVLKGNIVIGNSVSIGHGAVFMSTGAKISIHDFVVMGPNVTIYTGDHAIDIIGKHIIEISDSDKKNTNNPLNYDKDVVIESGCWIGTRAIILKGVTVGRGSVIGAGAIVTRDVPPYSVYSGVPSARIKPRFTEEQIVEHEKELLERGMPIDSLQQ